MPVTEYEAGLRKIIKYLTRRGGYATGSNSSSSSNATSADAAKDDNEALSSGRVRLLLLTPPPVDEVRCELGWGGAVCYA